MARVVVCGGGFAGASVAVRLAKLRHEVVLLEAGDRVGGRLRGHPVGGATWQLSPATFTLPGVLRDLFRKSGRPLDAALTIETLPGRRHLFDDKTAWDLPMGRRSDQVDAVTALVGQDAWSPWVDAMPEAWDVLRRRMLHRVRDADFALDRTERRTLGTRRSLRRDVRKALDDERLRRLALDPTVLGGDDPRMVPSLVSLDHYLERNFGLWHVVGGLPALADALERRLGERRVEVRTGLHVLDVRLDGGRVVGVETEDGPVDAEVVVWCAPTWPASLPRPALLPAIPASRTLLRLGPDAPEVPDDVMTHGDPPMRLWRAGDDDRWAVAHQNAEDPLVALVRVGLDLRPHVVERHDLPPTELVRLGHWGWQWRGFATMAARPGGAHPLPGGLFMAGAHAHPGPTIEQIGLATEAIAEHLGAVPRRPAS